jgi:glycine/D-amino acid oxidase-like deaminating enzyme
MAAVKKIDFLIVGQGLAGSSLASQLLLRKKKILVVNNRAHNTSSEVAAGIYNPVTGKMLAKTWMANEIFPFLETFYSRLEEITGSRFYHPLPIYRPFADITEQNEWMGRSEDSRLAAYVKKVWTAPAYPGTIIDPLGGLLMDHCGYVNTKAYVAAVREWLANVGSYEEGNFVYGNLNVGLRSVRYGNYEAAAAVFCEGCRVFENPWFNWVPVKPLKGELLTIQGKFLHEVIVNRGVYMVPVGGNGSWYVGATYEREFDEPGITEVGRIELEKKLRALTGNPFVVTGQAAGIRPSTPDRRPMLGAHPEHPNLILFNGLGTKGVSLSPYFAAELVHWLEKEKHLSREVDISRYKSLYWNSR